MKTLKHIGIFLLPLLFFAGVVSAQSIPSQSPWFYNSSNQITQIKSGAVISISGLSDGCLGLVSSILTSTGISCGSGSGGTFSFTPTSYGNSTTSIIGFLNGIIIGGASSTIPYLGTGTVNVNNGLLYSGATTTFSGGAIYSNGNVTIGGLSPSNFTSANISQWTNDSGYVTSSFSTTSANFWSSLGLGFSTTSASNFSALGLAFSTTSSNYWGSQQGYAKFGYLFPLTSTNFGATANATSSIVSFNAGLFASSTSYFANTTTTLATLGTAWLPSLATPAGTFLAADAMGKIIATTTPSGSNSAFSPAANYATTGVLPSYTYTLGVITEVANGALSIDGANPSVGQRVLVKNESGACTSSSGGCNNGLYDVTAAGSGIAAFVLTRDAAYNSSSNVIPGIITYVISGTVNNDDFYAMTAAAPITIGTTALTYVEVSGGGSSVTSVGLSAPAIFTVSNSPVTSSGTLTLSYSGTALPVANGGTSLTTFTKGDIPYSNATNALTQLGIGTAGQVLMSSNGVPVWAATSTSAGNSFAYPFPLLGLGTSTGLMFLGSTTIGNGNQNGGLTISGGATTTGNAYVMGNLGVGIKPVTSLGLLVQNNSEFNGTVDFGNDIFDDGGSWFLNATEADTKYNYVVNGESSNFGIGTSSPWGKLSVSGIAATTTPEFVVASSTGVTNFEVAYTGNVGIASTSPFGLLSVDLVGQAATQPGEIIHQQSGGTSDLLDIYNFNASKYISVNSSGNLVGASGASFTGALGVAPQISNVRVQNGNANGYGYIFQQTGVASPSSQAFGVTSTNGATNNDVFFDINSLGNTAVGTGTTPFALSVQTPNGYGSQEPLFDVASVTSAIFATSSIFRITANGNVGIASTTPFSTLSVGTGLASSSVTVAEYKYGAGTNVATSTAMQADCNASTQLAIPIGTSATTITLVNLTPGKKCIVVVQNPGATAGAITWAVSAGHILKWAGGTIPTQTTTANTMDIWSFLDTMGSSTQEVIGAATLNN